MCLLLSDFVFGDWVWLRSLVDGVIFRIFFKVVVFLLGVMIVLVNFLVSVDVLLSLFWFKGADNFFLGVVSCWVLGVD